MHKASRMFGKSHDTRSPTPTNLHFDEKEMLKHSHLLVLYRVASICPRSWQSRPRCSNTALEQSLSPISPSDCAPDRLVQDAELCQELRRHVAEKEGGHCCCCCRCET